MSGTTASAIGNLFKKKFLDPAMYKASKDNFFNKEKGESGENSGDDKAQIVLGVEKGLKLGSLQGKLMNATQRIKVEKMIEKARLRKFLEAKMKEEVSQDCFDKVLIIVFVIVGSLFEEEVPWRVRR